MPQQYDEEIDNKINRILLNKSRYPRINWKASKIL